MIHVYERHKPTLCVGDEVIWKPGGSLPPSVETVREIRKDVDLFTGKGESVQEIAWEELRVQGPSIAVFLDNGIPTHGWLLDPIDPGPLERDTPYSPGDPVLFGGDSPFLPAGTLGVVHSVSANGVEVLFENGYRFTISSALLQLAPEPDPSQEPSL